MSRELDRRDFSVNRVTPAREAELRSRALDVSNRLPGAHRIRIERFDALTGNPLVVASEAAPAEPGNYIQRALDHVQHISQALGLEATQPVEFIADPHSQRTTSDAVAVHLQQQYKGIDIFQAAETVRFAPDGALKETVGSRVTIAQELSVSPRQSVEEAVRKAAEHVATPHPDEQGAKDQFGEPLDLPRVNLTNFAPQVIATFPNKPDRSTVLEAGPFGDEIKANLLWFPLGEDLRLAWEVIISMPQYAGQYRTMVDATNGEILYCHQLVHTVAARGNVYRVDGSSPRQMTNFPRLLADYELPLPAVLPTTFPDDWVTADQSVGNSTRAHLGDNGPAIGGSLQNNIVTFDPSDSVGDDQKVLNIFYYNCYMHDFFYLLGFRETEGNFQHDDLGRGGVGGDRVDARAHSGAVWGTANMGTPVDGLSPVMNMGLVTSTNRHTAFDSSVVFHEFMHGVTNRLVGGPMNDRALEEPQSGGMGEGWGDYIACTIDDSTVVGSWVVNRPAGIRGFPYTSNFPDTFANLGSGRYDEVHNIGEIWCATLLEINRRIGKKLGVQLVVDALKLSPANPSFLDMRDAILSALDNTLAAGHLTANEHTTARRDLWTVFARFGMGPNARSHGASLSGVVADFQVPVENPTEPVGSEVQVEASPNLAIPDNQQTGVVSVLQVPQSGQLTRVTVSVDIAHPYSGDLQVSLTSPAGSTVILHNRTGASADNVIKTYATEDTPALAGFVGQQARGDWRLRVADLAARDLGMLRHWRLKLDLAAPITNIRGEAAPALTIPDNNPAGISSTIAIAQTGTARGLKVSVDITHTFIGDLQVELIAPSGQRAILHNRAGSGQDNLITTYDSATVPALTPLLGQSVQGQWSLRVMDRAGQDVGKLNKWSLELAL